MYPQLSNRHRSPKPYILLAVAVALAVIGILIYRSTQFHIVRTDPKRSAVSTVSPYIRVYFNDPLNQSSLRYTDDEKVLSTITFSEKSITFYFKENLTKGVRYPIAIASIKNKAGERLQNQDLTFVAKDIDFNKLSGEQKKALISHQDERLYEVESINYANFNKLLDYGITSGQLYNIKNQLYDYTNIIGKKYWTMALNPTTIVVTNHNAASADTQDKLDFSLKLPDGTYKAHAEYEVLYDSIHLQLFNASGAVVYDSANGSDQ